MLAETFLAALHISHQIQLGLSFLKPHLCKFRHHLYSTPGWPPPVSTSLASFVCLNAPQHCLHIHTGLLPPTLDFLLFGMDLRSQLSWIPLLSMAIIHGNLPSRSLKRLKSALLKSRVVVLLFALLPPFKILNSTILWSRQPRLPPTLISPTSSSLFVASGPCSLFALQSLDLYNITFALHLVQ